VASVPLIQLADLDLFTVLGRGRHRSLDHDATPPAARAARCGAGSIGGGGVVDATVAAIPRSGAN